MSALINPTWWLLCGAFVLCVAARNPHRALRNGLRWATATPVLVLIAAAAVANLGARAMLGHAVPGDFAQEVIAARSVRTHNALYPADVNAEVATWLADDPPALPRWLPGRVSRWLEGRQRTGRNRLVAQAHPPTLLLVTTPLVLVLGAYGAYWALTILTVAAAALSASLLVRSFAQTASAREHVLAGLLLVSWQPVLATVRDGQVSVIIGALLVSAWAGLRGGRDTRAGIAIGMAAALKLYPLIILAPLALRRRRAFATACITIAGAVAAVLLAAGTDAWTDYAASGRTIARAFATAPYNLSLLARLGALAPASLVLVIYAVLAVCVVIATLIVGRTTDAAPPPAIPDVEFAGFVTLAILLSPVAWHHYVVALALPVVVLAVVAWRQGGRAALACTCLLALILSVPDDGWRAIWREVPGQAALFLSPGLAVLLLWGALLLAGTRGSRAAVPPELPAGGLAAVGK